MAINVVGSNMPTRASEALKPQFGKPGYGQGGWNGASSDMPNEPPTTSGFLPTPDTASAMDKVSARDGEYRGGRVGKGNPPSPGKVGDLTGTGKETRDVGAPAIKPAFGMDRRTPRNR